jgi:alkylhydroperoxidase family enzyme
MTASETEARLALADDVLPGKPPINLFRLFSRNPAMFEAMSPWGDYTLGRSLSLSMRLREIVIDRVTARCGAEYEWAIHVAYFGARVGFTPEQVASLAHGAADDPCWDDDERVVLRAVDALHDTNDLDDALWAEVTARLTDEQVLDLLLLAGWYHAISYVARAARVPLDDGVPRFADYAAAAMKSLSSGEPGSG